MTIVADLIERTRTEYLEPPDELWIRTALTAAVDNATTQWPVDLALLTAEEQEMLGLGVLVEAESEQALITVVTGATLTVRRGLRGTTPAAHPADTEVLVKPPWGRTEIFEAVRESIVALHPPLYATKTTTVTVGANGITEIPADVISPVALRDPATGAGVAYDDLGDFDAPGGTPTGRTLKVLGGAEGTDLLLQYQGRLLFAADESADIATLGLREEWARIAVVGAAAGLIARKPLSVRQQEFLTSQLRTEGYPVETPSRIRDSLLRLHEFWVSKAAGDLARSHTPDIIQG